MSKTEQKYLDEARELMAEAEGILEGMVDTGDGRVIDVKYVDGRIRSWLLNLNKFDDKWGKYMTDRNVWADELIEDAVGMLSDIMADDSTRDGEPPSGKEITRWAEQWLGEATTYLKGE